ncbi:helicase-associated domain-containing protein [Nesterenkonia aethiopica]|uniref:Helicase XPB/Ssl2 N-terminal domain-containing protein n=2 Tax=Actinomycetes TaxID=1760 RepID=A0ABP6LTX4_9MICC
MQPTLLGLAALARRLSSRDDDAVAALLRSRPDLVHPSPGDFTGLAVRAQSDMSLRHCLQRLDAGAFAVLAAATAGRPLTGLTEDALDPVLSRLARLGLIFAPDDRPAASSAPTAADAAAGRLAVPGSLPAVLAGLNLELTSADTDAALTPPGASPARGPAALVRNAALAAVAELLADVGDLLTVLEETPAAVLRTGGVGMRELRRLTGERSGASRPSDADVGETGWLLELAAAAGLVALDVDSDRWRTTPAARRWRRAPRHRQHQLLVSGWLLAPRSPLLLRSPHPTARLAPALTPDRQRGDAPALRARLLGTAAALGAELAEHLGRSAAPALYHLQLPDDQEPGPEALTGTLPDRMTWDRPVLLARVGQVLPPMVREAERLGLLAMGTLTEVGRLLAPETPAVPGRGEDHRPDAGSASAGLAERLARTADHLAEALPPQVDQIHVQSDLTAVAVGALAPEVSAGLEAIAQKETRGGVPTFRFTAASLRRGISAGWTAERIREFLAAHSLAEIPSSLATLIDDAARTWQGVTIGAASSWLIERDPARRATLLQHPILRSLGLRELTTEVLVCDVDAERLARALAEAGVESRRAEEPGRDAAHATTPTGSRREAELAETAEAWTLPQSPWQQSPVRTLSAQQADPQLVSRTLAGLRAGAGARAGASIAGDADPDQDAVAAEATSPVGGTDVMGLLRTAVRSRQPVWLRRVDAEGREHTLSGLPTALNAGRVRIRQLAGEDESVLLVHRITAVRLLDETGDETPEKPGEGAAP